MPPGSMSCSACSPRKRCSEARRLEPASVRTSVPSGEIEGEKRLAAGEFGLRRTPMQTAGNHEMDDKPDVAIRSGPISAFDADGDAFADAAQLADGPAIDR